MKMTPEIPFAALHSRMGDYLPQLRKLRLHGVHLNWTNLPSLLPGSGLHSLELSEHPYEVRPTLADFRRILTSCPALQKLVVGVSGPVLDRDDSVNWTSVSSESGPIVLPHLKELTLGYTDADDARHVLQNLDAPNVKSLTIADTTSVTFSQTEDVGSLLVACATKTRGPAVYGRESASQNVAQLLTNGQTQGVDKPSFSRFPALEEVILDRVEACSVTPFRTFFGAFPTLNRLTLQHTSMHAILALIPAGEPWPPQFQGLAPPASPSPCPCPKLQSVHIRGAALDFDLISTARSARIKHGAYAFDPEITLDHCRADDVVQVDTPVFEGMEVRIRSGDPYQAGGIDFEDAVMDLEMENATKGPFVFGAGFQDPAFDAYYGSHISILPQF
jgi:hypothetical protein